MSLIIHQFELILLVHLFLLYFLIKRLIFLFALIFLLQPNFIQFDRLKIEFRFRLYPLAIVTQLLQLNFRVVHLMKFFNGF
jgi:hypothetical protein